MQRSYTSDQATLPYYVNVVKDYHDAMVTEVRCGLRIESRVTQLVAFVSVVTCRRTPQDIMRRLARRDKYNRSCEQLLPEMQRHLTKEEHNPV